MQAPIASSSSRHGITTETRGSGEPASLMALSLDGMVRGHARGGPAGERQPLLAVRQAASNHVGGEADAVVRDLTPQLGQGAAVPVAHDRVRLVDQCVAL